MQEYRDREQVVGNIHTQQLDEEAAPVEVAPVELQGAGTNIRWNTNRHYTHGMPRTGTFEHEALWARFCESVGEVEERAINLWTRATGELRKCSRMEQRAEKAIFVDGEGVGGQREHESPAASFALATGLAQKDDSAMGVPMVPLLAGNAPHKSDARKVPEPAREGGGVGIVPSIE